MLKFIFIISLSFILPSLVSTDSNADGCQRHPIFCQIIDNHPTIDKKYAFNLSKLIVKIAHTHKIDPRLLTAIMAQESKYDVTKKNCNERYCTDFGIAQINWKTADVYNFDRNLLTSDLEYSINAGAIVLAEIKARYAHKEEDYWTRYNASSPSKRNEYKLLVARYL